MYTRDFQSESDSIQIPTHYDGTALYNEAPPSEEVYEECSKIVENKEKEPSFLDKLHLKSTFPFVQSLFKKDFKIGTEELIIIGVIAFLIFTKGADTELGMMLLLLLFIS
jgi:hypothetical protein